MSYDVKNGQLQPKPQPTLQLSPQQLTSIVVLERRIVELNNDASVFQQMGALPLALACEQATVALSKAHDEYIAETQRAVKLAGPADVPKLVSV